MMSNHKQIVPTAFRADAQQQSYPPLSEIYGGLTEHRFKHLYRGTWDNEQTFEYETLFHKYIQLKKNYKALEEQLNLYKKDYVDEMLKNSKL